LIEHCLHSMLTTFNLNLYLQDVWTAKDIAYWLELMGLSQYMGSFEKHDVKGDMLLTMNPTEWRKIINNDWDRHVLQTELKKLEKKPC